MKLLSTALSSAIALAFAQAAFAQPSSIDVHPKSSDISVEQSGVQNSQQIGEGNQSTQTYGNQNQSTTQSGADNTSTTQSGTQNQSAVGSGNQQSQQYGTGNTSSQSGAGSTAANEQNRQYGDYDRDRSASSGATSEEENKRDNQGWHKGWAKNKHRDESSGKYNPESAQSDSNSSYGGTRWR